MQVPIYTLPLFSKLDILLQDTLRNISVEDWQQPTISPQWTVGDIAAHLLDGNLRALSMLRDQYFGESPKEGEALVPFLNRLNAEWIRVATRLSPQVILHLLQQSGEEYRSFLHSLDPWATATFAVAWAGEEESANWFHIAREYTEKWHHQAQIRMALGHLSPLLESDLYLPFLDTSVRVIPHHFEAYQGKGNSMQIVVKDLAKATYTFVKSEAGWQQTASKAQLSTKIVLEKAHAWRYFVKGIRRDQAEHFCQWEGEKDLFEHFLEAKAIMA